MNAFDEFFEQFMEAIKQGHLSDVKKLKQDKFINRKWLHDRKCYGYAPLHLAALCGNSKQIFTKYEPVRHHQGAYLLIVKYLIANGADVDALIGDDDSLLNDIRLTPLHLAAEVGRLDIVKVLVSSGADVNKSHKNGWTPLIAAAAGGNLRVVRYLEKNGAVISTSADVDDTSLSVAVRSGWFKTLKYFLKERAHINQSTRIGGTLLGVAATAGYLNIVKYLIYNGADVNKSNESGWTPLHLAACFNRLDIVKYLIWKRAVISPYDVKYGTPLHTAAAEGNLEVVKYLISHGADISLSSSFLGTPLHGAAARDHLEIVKYLIDKGADVNVALRRGDDKDDFWFYLTHDAKNVYPLHSAAANGYLDVVDCLMEHGGDVKLTDDDGRMLLHFAAIYGSMKIVKKADTLFGNEFTTATDKYGRTAMHFAAACGHMDAFEYILAKGGDAFLPDKNGRTPLHYAAGWGNLSIVEYLTSHGVDVNAVDVGGCTPIHYAAACPKKMDDGTVIDAVAVVRHLINCGANFELKTKACHQMDALTFCNNKLCTSKEFSKSFIQIRKFNRQHVTEGFYCHGMRPAHLACAMEKADVLKCLLQSGCMMNANDDDNNIPSMYAKPPHYRQKCLKVWYKHQEIVRNDEFQLFHLETFTIVCRKFKIFDFKSVAQMFQLKVMPLNRPVFFCNFAIPPSCFSSSCVVIRLLSPWIQYPEYLVVKSSVEFETIRGMINDLRHWNIEYTSKLQHNDATGNAEIFLQMQPVERLMKWTNNLSVGFQQTEQGKPYGELTYALLQENDKGKFIKNIFVDFLKCLHSVEIEREFSENKTKDSVCATELLRKAVVLRMPLMTFFDENNRKLSNETALTISVAIDYIPIFVARKNLPDVVFCSYQADENVQQTITTFAREDSVLVKGMVDGCPTFVILLRNAPTVADIKDKIKVVLGKGSRLEIVSDKGLISDDTKTEDVRDVITYLIVEQFLPGEIQRMDKIGSGGYGTVCPCTISDSNERFALKKIKIENENDMNNNRGIINEILVAARIDSHPRIMKYIGFYETDKRFYIRMDLMKQSLSDYVKQNKPLDEETIKHFTKQILQGLEHLHDNKIIHRDIKGPNVLLDESNNAKLTDFGISKCLDNTQAGAETQVGTCSYMAPEIITKVDSGPYGFKCDIWSVGATMVEMITGERPFHEILAQFTIIYKLGSEKKIPFQCPDYFTSEIRRFVDWCLTADPTERPDCKEVLCDKFLV